MVKPSSYKTSAVKTIKKSNPFQVKPSKKDLLRVTEYAPDVICRFDKTFRLLYVNPAIEKVTGIPMHKFINKTTREIGMPDEHSMMWEEQIKFVFSSGKQTTLEFPMLSPSGLRQFHSLLVPEFTSSGVIETVLSISRDVTEIKAQSKEVVGFVSHELKTPVTVLKLFAQMLQQKFIKTGDMNMAGRLAEMDMQIDKLTNIIGDLAEATRIENHALKFQKEEFNFNVFLKEVVSDIQKITKMHKIKMKGKVKKNITADRLRIGQVLTNLLSNAIKYSHRSSEILVKVSSDNKKVTCCVEDRGIGIPKEKQQKIFERFYRINDSQHKSSLGLGLGLYISSEIIKKHGGKIWVESKEGKGSKFYFTLPIG